ncbi:hypothetical protein M514_09973 [Trichuris suis]|uniref:Uncharacterized protein n=1 Tax=Trichuris suis TaxID=68888 RepID=A0A085LW03_9BILA|nr:hypothetical protein M513_09973 [Trichuris suis]KFD62180.1 hypothetical protein M514_09973 [Trichuris suis]
MVCASPDFAVRKEMLYDSRNPSSPSPRMSQEASYPALVVVCSTYRKVTENAIYYCLPWMQAPQCLSTEDGGVEAALMLDQPRVS